MFTKTKYYMRVTALLLLCLSALETAAQHPGQVEFWHLTTDDGLSQSTGIDILQDYKGYMWIGTQDGLNKYNGHEVTVYRSKDDDSTSIGSNDIAVIFEDSNHNLWIGTKGGGLSLYNREQDNFTTIRELLDGPDKTKGITDHTVFSLSEDDDGNLWVGTNNGLNIKPARQDTFQHIFSDPNDPNTISDDYIESLFKDSRGNMWVGTASGLNRYDAQTDSFHRIEEVAANDLIYYITETKDGKVWIGTDHNGLLMYDYTTDDFTQYLHETNGENFEVNSIFSIKEDSRGVLWIGTESSGLLVFDRETGRFHQYLYDAANPSSLSNDAVYSLYESRDQILWIGTYTGGINLVDRKIPQIRHYQYDPFDYSSLNNNSVHAFLEDDAGNFWVGTDGGGLDLFNRRNETFQNFMHEPGNPNSISNNSILELAKDQQGYIWLGGYNGGVSRFDYEQNRFTHYKHDPNTEGGLSQNHIFALMTDSQNRVWVGTNGTGVDTLDTTRRRFNAFGPDSVRIAAGTINISYVRSFLEDQQGNFWIGTYGSGVIRFNPETKKFQAYHTYNSNINNNVILSMYQDTQGRLWIGTKGGGVNRYLPDTDSFEAHEEADGLKNATVNGILEDDHARLWMSTSEGIIRYNPDSGETLILGVDDGLQGTEFNPGAAYEDSRGYFYFGGVNGFNRFHPDSIKPNEFIHPVVLTDFKIFNRSVDIGETSPLKKHISEAETIRLEHNISVLTFEYATLNYNRVKGNRYAYKMDGFDENWNEVGEKRSATYTNLDPGKYTFRVRVYNNENVLSTQEASVGITITPPYWKTGWFYVISGLGVLLLGYGIFRYRVRSIRERNILLEREVSNRTAELDQRNKELQQTLKDLEETRQELIENAHKAGMADIATGVLHNVGNILNSVNTSSALIEDTLEKSKLMKLKQANALLRKHEDDIEDFILNNPKGKQLLGYYLKLEKPLEQEHENIQGLAERLTRKINLINEVIAAQQSYATSTTNSERCKLHEIVDETLMLNAGSTQRHNIDIVKNYESYKPVVCQRTKLVHVLVNLIKNAKEAMAGNKYDDKRLVIDLFHDEQFVYLKIKDNGHGISGKNLQKIFNQGFTTKTSGHGFGLHSSANYIREMGGEIEVDSEGENKGTEFTLKFKRADRDTA